MLQIYIIVIILFITSVVVVTLIVTDYHHTEQNGLAVRIVGLNSISVHFLPGPAPPVIVAKVSRVCSRPLENSKLIAQLGHNLK
jgi:hypothetical protein